MNLPVKMKGENLLLLDSNVFSYCTADFYINVLCHQPNASANLIKLIHLFDHSVIRHNDAKNMTPPPSTKCVKLSKIKNIKIYNVSLRAKRIFFTFPLLIKFKCILRSYLSLFLSYIYIYTYAKLLTCLRSSFTGVKRLLTTTK